MVALVPTEAKAKAPRSSDLEIGMKFRSKPLISYPDSGFCNWEIVNDKILN